MLSSPHRSTIRWPQDRRRLWWFLLGLYILSLGVALLAPFDFYRPWRVNHARWTDNGDGLHLEGVSIVQSETVPHRLYQRLVVGNGLSLAVWVKSASLDQYGPARIVSYSRDNKLRNFTLGQEGASLIMRLRTTATDRNGLRPQMVVPDVFKANSWQHLVVTYDFDISACMSMVSFDFPLGRHKGNLPTGTPLTLCF